VRVLANEDLSRLLDLTRGVFTEQQPADPLV